MTGPVALVGDDSGAEVGDVVLDDGVAEAGVVTDVVPEGAAEVEDVAGGVVVEHAPAQRTAAAVAASKRGPLRLFTRGRYWADGTEKRFCTET